MKGAACAAGRSRLAVGSRPRPSVEPTSNKQKNALQAAADNLY